MYDISKTQSFSPTSEVCDCTTRFFGSDTVSGFYFGPSKKALIKELWFDLVDEIAVLLNREVTKEEIRFTGMKPSAAH